jgi:cytochrome c553
MPVKTLVAAALLGLAMPIVSLAGVAHAQGDRAFGEYLSSECVTCHQLSGRYEGIPPIVGWPEKIFVEVMLEYRQKKRSNPIMETVAARLSEQEIAALAAYFKSVPTDPRK